MKYVTLQDIRANRPCASGWHKLLKYLNAQPSDHRRVALSTILKSNGIQDAVWCLQARPKIDRRLFAADVAESVLHIFEESQPHDKRVRRAIEVAKNINATHNELTEAASVASDAGSCDLDVNAFYAAIVAFAAACSDAEMAGQFAEDIITEQRIEQIFLKHFG